MNRELEKLSMSQRARILKHLRNILKARLRMWDEASKVEVIFAGNQEVSTQSDAIDDFCSCMDNEHSIDETPEASVLEIFDLD